MGESAFTNAPRKSSRISAGSACTCAGEMLTPPPPTRAATCGGSFDSSSARREAKIAPNSATPSEPPIERKNVAVLVATPMSFGGAQFCTASTSTCITRPMPMPTTSM